MGGTETTQIYDRVGGEAALRRTVDAVPRINDASRV
jgi:hypothetical protein